MTRKKRPTRLLRLPMVLGKTGLSRSSLYELVSIGEFPKPVRLANTRCVGWDEVGVDAWIDLQISQQESEA